jgi:chromosome segregation ATPase
MSWWPWGKKARERKALEAASAVDAEKVRKALTEAKAQEAAQKIQEIAAAYIDPYKLQQEAVKKATHRARNTGRSLQGIAWHQTAMTPIADPMAAIKLLRDEFEHHRECWTMNEQAYNKRIAELTEKLAEQETLIAEMQDEIEALKMGVALD